MSYATNQISTEVYPDHLQFDIRIPDKPELEDLPPKGPDNRQHALFHPGGVWVPTIDSATVTVTVTVIVTQDIDQAKTDLARSFTLDAEGRLDLSAGVFSIACVLEALDEGTFIEVEQGSYVGALFIPGQVTTDPLEYVLLLERC